MAEKKSMKRENNTNIKPQEPAEGAFISMEDSYYSSELFSSGEIFKLCEFDESKGPRFRCQTLTFPGDEPILEKIENSVNCTVTNKIITPMPKEGIIMVYVEWEEV